MADQFAQWPPGTSSTAAQVRAIDWSQTPLGASLDWPPSLRIAVNSTLDSPVATIVLWGADLLQIYNDSYQVILGERHPHAMGQATRDCWPEVWHFNAPIYADVMATGKTIHYADQEFVLGPPESSATFYFTVNYAPLRDENGRIPGVIVQVVETTARIMLEREHAKLAKIAECSSKRQAFNLLLVDALRSLQTMDDVIAKSSEILGIHLCASRVMYCEVDEGRGTFDIRRDWTGAGVQSIAGVTRYLADFGSEFISALRLGKFLAVDDLKLDLRAADVLASYASMNIKSFLAVPLVRNGALSVVLTIHRTEPYAWTDAEIQLTQDFIERTGAAAENAKAQATLRAERDRSQAIFDCMTEGFGLVDRDGLILQMNDEGLRIAQHSASEVIGHNLWKVWPEIIGTPLSALYAKVIETGTPGSIEYEHTFWNGVKTWLEVRVYRTPSHELAIFYRDIDYRKLAEAALVEADQRKDEFLAMLAHELRNPLAPIKNALHIMRRTETHNVTVQSASAMMERQISHMVRLVEDLLDASRISRGNIELRRVDIELAAAIELAVEASQPFCDRMEHKLTISLPDHAVYLNADPTRLAQIIGNLLNNACKFTKKGGRITLAVTCEANEAVIKVTDNGVGIEANQFSRIFELFTQIDTGLERSRGGLGIGLSLVKRLVEMHGGSLEVFSAGIDLGSEFVVRLPILANSQSHSTQESTDDQTTQPYRILVVDDNQDAATSMAELLELVGHQTYVAHDGLEAVQRAEALLPDIVLLDIGLPKLNGFEAARKIRHETWGKTMVLVAITGMGQDEDRRKTAEVGFNGHLVKPVDLDLLMALLTKLQMGMH